MKGIELKPLSLETNGGGGLAHELEQWQLLFQIFNGRTQAAHQEQIRKPRQFCQSVWMLQKNVEPIAQS